MNFVQKISQGEMTNVSLIKALRTRKEKVVSKSDLEMANIVAEFLDTIDFFRLMQLNILPHKLYGKNKNV